uniref:OSJNBa0042D13.20 protein n=1 Tax=Oryza sativa subsp. japonica TaxID=39947 RepID=Q7X707_ORYSJ|nr:OSJNBa0042D13.20 [Oryza sativa Japonica Group]
MQGNVERDVEGNEVGNKEEEASGSQSSAGQKRARGQQGATKKLEGQHIITEVDEDGRPSAPAEVAKNYVRHSGWVVRDNVPVSKRSKFWYYAHGGTLNPVDGSLVFSDQIRDAASRLTDAVETSSHATFRPDRKKDKPSLAVQTPKHPGRMRGKGVVPWKIGLKEDIHTYRSQMRSKRDTEAKIADLEYRVSSYKLSMQEEVARKVDERMVVLRSQDPQPYIPPVMADSTRILEGQAAYEDLELDYPGGDGSCAVSSGIFQVKVSPSSTACPHKGNEEECCRHQKQEPSYDCTQEELDTYVAAEVKRQLKPRSPEKQIPVNPSAKNFFKKMSGPVKEVLKLTDYERTLRKAYFGKSKPVPQLAEQPNQEVEPLVTEMSANGREMFGARIKNSDFFQGEDVLWIHFKGIYELYQLDALVVSLLSAWILMEIQRAQRWGVFDTGFIDPRKVFELVDRAWDRFRTQVRGTWKEKLSRRFKFPCTKQSQGTNLCGYYVCEYCHCLTTQFYTTRELDVIHMRDNLTHKEFIAAVQEQLMGFINEQVLDPDGEFY